MKRLDPSHSSPGPEPPLVERKKETPPENHYPRLHPTGTTHVWGGTDPESGVPTLSSEGFTSVRRHPVQDQSRRRVHGGLSMATESERFLPIAVDDPVQPYRGTPVGTYPLSVRVVPGSSIGSTKEKYPLVRLLDSTCPTLDVRVSRTKRVRTTAREGQRVIGTSCTVSSHVCSFSGS